MTEPTPLSSHNKLPSASNLNAKKAKTPTSKIQAPSSSIENKQAITRQKEDIAERTAEFSGYTMDSIQSYIKEHYNQIITQIKQAKDTDSIANNIVELISMLKEHCKDDPDALCLNVASIINQLINDFGDINTNAATIVDTIEEVALAICNNTSTKEVKKQLEDKIIPNLKRLHQTKEGIKEKLALLGEDPSHLNKFVVHPLNQMSTHEAGKGKTNSVAEQEFSYDSETTNTTAKATVIVKTIKPDKTPARSEKKQCLGTGIPLEKLNTAGRNFATTATCELLPDEFKFIAPQCQWAYCESSSESDTQGEIGIAMSKAPGFPAAILLQGFHEAVGKIPPEKLEKSPEYKALQESDLYAQVGRLHETGQLADLLNSTQLEIYLTVMQVLDALSGTVDRHLQNFNILIDAQNNCLGVFTFDNDTNWGSALLTSNITEAYQQNLAKHNISTQLPDLVSCSRNMPSKERLDRNPDIVQMFLNIERNEYQAKISKFLSPADIKAAMLRFDDVMAQLKEPKEANITKLNDNLEWIRTARY